jgi:chitinase
MKFRCLLFLLVLTFGLAIAQRPVIITYAGGYRGNLVKANQIEAAKLTHLLYAFANLSNNRAYLQYPKTDVVNLHNLVALKRQNPKLKVLLSVGGLGWSHNFSNMALTEAGRQTFATSCAELMERFNLDGIDIDWEFPGYPGEGGNIYRPEDKQNYTLTFKALRECFDQLEQKTRKHYLITTAVDGWAPHFVPHTEMDKVQQYVDYVCLMAYNFNTPELAGGHFLYSPRDWDPQGSADGAVKGFMDAGVPDSKLVLGAGFFPAAFQMTNGDPLNRKYTKRPIFRGGLARVARLPHLYGWKRYWDEEGKAPYFFNDESWIRVSYEDAESLQAKCNYIKDKKLAGLMYWDYFSDPGRKLLHIADQSFGY